ncbi:LPS translocon maturation chaperone LptM [Rhodopila sp.]
MKARGVRTAVVLACTVAVGLLAGCGKKGPPDPPGPPADIIYPKTYPTR